MAKIAPDHIGVSAVSFQAASSLAATRIDDMSLRGLNGTTGSTLEGRFVKCPNCKVNLIKSDVEEYGQCTICKTPINCGDAEDAHIKASLSSPKPRNSSHVSNMKRVWTAIPTTTRSGKETVYYHNNVTGVDVWERPDDFEELTNVDRQTDMMKLDQTDFVKTAVLRQERQREAEKMGVQLPPEEPLLTPGQQMKKAMEEQIADSVAPQADPSTNPNKPPSPRSCTMHSSKPSETDKQVEKQAASTARRRSGTGFQMGCVVAIVAILAVWAGM